MNIDEERAKFFGIELEEYLTWKEDANKDTEGHKDKRTLYHATKLYYYLHSFPARTAYLQTYIALLDEELEKCFLKERECDKDIYKEKINELMKNIKSITDDINRQQKG